MDSVAVEIKHRLLPILLSQAVGIACGIAGITLVSALVEPSDYGAYGVFISLAAVGVSVIYAGVIKFVSRNWIETTSQALLLQNALRGVARRSPWMFASAIVAAAVAAPASPLFYGGLLLTSAVFLALLQIAQSALQAAREHWRDLAVTTGSSTMRSFLPPLLYNVTGLGLTALLLGFLAQAILGTLLAVWHLRSWRHTRSPDPACAMQGGVYDGPRFVFLAATLWLLVGLPRWLVAWRFGAETAGYFNLAMNIGGIAPTVLGAILLQYFQPQWFRARPVSQLDHRSLVRETNGVALGFTAAAVGASVGLQLCMPWLIGNIVGVRYAEAAVFITATGCWATTLNLGSFYHAMLLAAHREKDCTRVDLAGAFFLIAGTFICAQFGIDWLRRWLLVSPIVPWVVNQTLARRAMTKKSYGPPA